MAIEVFSFSLILKGLRLSHDRQLESSATHAMGCRQGGMFGLGFFFLGPIGKRLIAASAHVVHHLLMGILVGFVVGMLMASCCVVSMDVRRSILVKVTMNRFGMSFMARTFF